MSLKEATTTTTSPPPEQARTEPFLTYSSGGDGSILDRFQVTTTTTTTTLVVPRAEEWDRGLELLPQHHKRDGRTVVLHLDRTHLRVSDHPQVKTKGVLGAWHAVVLAAVVVVANTSEGTAAKEEEDVAIVQRIKPVRGFNEAYRVLTFVENYPGQEPEQEPWKDGRQVYLRGQVRQAFSGRKYQYLLKRPGGQEELVMAAENGTVACLFLSVPCCLAGRELRFEFHEPRNKRNILWVRDQATSTVKLVQPGVNMVDAVCVAYAVDRLANPMGDMYGARTSY